MSKICGLLAVLAVLLTATQQTQGLKILGVFPSPSKSHLILGTGLLKGLAEAGHEVTMVSPFPLDKPVKNYRDIKLQDLKQVIFDDHGTQNLFDMQSSSPISAIHQVLNMGLLMTDAALSDPAFKKFLADPNEKFDIIIIEVFLDEAVFALGNHFNAPVIAFSTVGASSWTNEMVGNIAPFASVPEMFLGLTDHMTFTERLLNTMVSTLNQVIRYAWYMPRQEAIMNKHFKNVPSLYNILTNTSLVLLNSHVSYAHPRSLVQNMIEIGGFHVQKPKPLPEDLKKYLDDAPQGVVYFSMGSNLQSKDLPPATRDAFLHAFSNIKQKVLWKWEDDKLPNQPKNLRISKWLPQQDLLAHPNVKVFITHGGLLSTTEAIERGVPLIGIPVFGDQKLNMGRAQSLGYGVRLDYTNVTRESVAWALNEVLNNPKYKETAKKRSQVLHDQDVPPMKKAVFWVEYVARYGGATHLRSSTTAMPLYQYLLLDVIVFVITIIALVLTLIMLVLCKAWQVAFGKKSTKTAEKKKKKQ